MKIVGFEIEEWEREMFNTIRNEHELLSRGNPLDTQVRKDFPNADADPMSKFARCDLSIEFPSGKGESNNVVS